MSEPFDIIHGPENKKIMVYLLQEEHVDSVYLLELASYPDAWSKELFLPEIDNKSGKFFVFLANDELIGYAGYWLGDDEAHITKFTVAPEHRRKGIGTLFMNFLFEQVKREGATKILLEVRENNHPARCLYEKMGFQTVGVRNKYYIRTQENAIVMKKELYNHSSEIPFNRDEFLPPQVSH